MQQTALRQTVRRIIVLGSAGALPDSLDKQPAWRRWIVQNIVYNTFLKWPVASQISQWNDPLRTAISTGPWSCRRCSPTRPAHGTYRIDGEAFLATAAASPAKT